MIPTLESLGCGILAGLFGGYLGLGGGIVIVPFLTLAMGIDIKQAVPVSMAAIVVNSLSASSEYMKKGMVDLEKKAYDYADSLRPIRIDEVIMGNVVGAGQGQNVARHS